MRTKIVLAAAIVALAAFVAAGCGNSATTNSDLQSTGLKSTPKLTPQQIQAAWEVRHPGTKAPM